MTFLQLDSLDDAVCVDEHVVLSRTGHWLFVLKEEANSPRTCFGFWFQIESEAADMETAMQRVVERALHEQVPSRLVSTFSVTKRMTPLTLHPLIPHDPTPFRA